MLPSCVKGGGGVDRYLRTCFDDEGGNLRVVVDALFRMVTTLDT